MGSELVRSTRVDDVGVHLPLLIDNEACHVVTRADVSRSAALTFDLHATSIDNHAMADTGELRVLQGLQAWY